MFLRLFHALLRWRLRLAGFVSRTIDTSQGPMHAMERRGHGPLPTLVLVHGICAEGSELADVLLRLRHHFSRIVVPDLPAHGLSADPRDGLTPETLHIGTLELLDVLTDPGAPALLVGNSMGGFAVLRYAHARPGRVRALYLSSPGGARVPKHAFTDFLHRLKLATWADGAEFAGRLYRRPPVYRWLIGGALRRLFARPVMARFIHDLGEEDMLSGEELETLPVPATMVWGSRDALLPEDQFEFYRAHLPEGTPIERPSWGHCPYLDTPRAMAASIVEWAEREVAAV